MFIGVFMRVEVREIPAPMAEAFTSGLSIVICRDKYIGYVLAAWYIVRILINKSEFAIYRHCLTALMFRKLARWKFDVGNSLGLLCKNVYSDRLCVMIM